ncbi:hypothetical protein DPMN_185896 [Dreissena polymorpha]|uniref:Uncharacterized protein n=1 Tax=Dreissena polymorpha TaxID=45954 RepID=A0A9D4I8V5_DREPO|nr:hypothetical protein DPMN_185896 [Dreissena polymorpha]
MWFSIALSVCNFFSSVYTADNVVAKSLEHATKVLSRFGKFECAEDAIKRGEFKAPCTSLFASSNTLRGV